MPLHRPFCTTVASTACGKAGPGAATTRCSDAYAASHEACDASASWQGTKAAKAANRSIASTFQPLAVGRLGQFGLKLAPLGLDKSARMLIWTTPAARRP